MKLPVGGIHKSENLFKPVGYQLSGSMKGDREE